MEDSSVIEDGAKTGVERWKEITEQWRMTLDALPELILSVSEDRSILRANRTLELFELGNVEDVRGVDLHVLLHRRCQRGASCYMEEAWAELRRNPSSALAFDCWDDALQRRLRLRLEVLSPGMERSPEDVWAVVVIEDITEEHRLRTAQTRRLRLETVASLMQGFAHEIGNPLASIRAAAQVVLHSWDRFDEAKKRTYLERILEGTERVQSVVDRGLRSHLWTVGKLGPVAVAGVFEALREAFDARARQQETKLLFLPLPEVGLAVCADFEALEAALGVILENALDAWSEGGQVVLAAKAENGEVRLEVRDGAGGIPRENLRHVFQPFYTTKAKGVGLGMSHADHLVLQMEGRIEIASRDEQGTTVAVILAQAGA